MSRRKVTDRRVRAILAAFDHVAAIPDRGESDLCSFMHLVVDTGCERFQIPGGWTAEGIREILVAFLVHAPAGELEEMVKAARREVAWHDAWQRQAAYEKKHGHAPKGCVPIDSEYHPEDLAEVA